MTTKIFAPGPKPNTVYNPQGEVVLIPEGWILLPPGDAGFTRRVKLAGEHWAVQEKRGRKIFPKGVYAPAETINQIRAELEKERATESYAKRKQAAANRRDKVQGEYVATFTEAILQFLAFHPNHAALANQFARVVSEHATPVGSGTVARTKAIPVEKRAEAAVIAWLRHKTSAYDTMKIARIKGKRREVRRLIAQRSRELLAQYRQEHLTREEPCPLAQALAKEVVTGATAKPTNDE